MDPTSVKQRIERALARLRPTAGQADLVALDLVNSVEVDDSGAVRVALALRPGDDPALLDTVRLVLSGLEGVSRLEVRAHSPGSEAPAGTVPLRPRPGSTGRRPLPVVGQAPGASAEAAGPAGPPRPDRVSRDARAKQSRSRASPTWLP